VADAGVFNDTEDVVVVLFGLVERLQDQNASAFTTSIP